VKKTILMVLLMLAGVLALMLSACHSNLESKPNYIFKPAPKQGVVANINGKEITEDQLNKGIESELYEAEMRLYEIKKARLDTIVLENLIAADPRKGTMSNDAFLQKFIGIGKSPSDKEITSFIEERKIPKEHINEQLKERIKKYLEMENKRNAVDEWISEKTKKNPIIVHIQEPSHPVFDVAIANAPAWGSANAKVTIVEFSEFECPFCGKASEVINQVKKKYNGKIRLVFKHFPLSFHQHAKKASEAAMCAFEQSPDKFWTMHDALFAGQDKLDEDSLKEKAKKIGLDLAKFEGCLKTGKFTAHIDADLKQGEALGIRATPTFFVNGQMLSGALPLESFTEIIDKELAK
jgi:predicted DsbA family dithiol-disulfide isomerase